MFLDHLFDWRAQILALVFQFLLTGAMVFGICTGIKSYHNSLIDEWILAGVVVTSTCPTTIASNVIMTKKAKGTFEKLVSMVFTGNLFGAFFLPLLVQMYFQSPGWEFANPKNGTTFTAVYRRVMKQLGCTVFVPLFLGQCVVNLNPEKVLYWNQRLRLGKVASICLLLNIYSSFSTAFYQKAFTTVPGASIIMVFFMNIGLYVVFSLVTFFLVRNGLVKKLFVDRDMPAENHKVKRLIHRFFESFYFNKPDTVALLFLCPAKSAALAIALATSQYGDDFRYLGKILAPLVLYLTQQVLLANFCVVPLRKWVQLDTAMDKDSDESSSQVEDQNFLQPSGSEKRIESNHNPIV